MDVAQGQYVADLLRRHGVSPTPQRQAIAELVLSRKQHVSAEQVMAKLADAGYRVSKATVYNTLGAFARAGLLREVIVDPSRSVIYDSNTAPHYHFYNVDTGALSDIPADQVRFADLPEIPEGTEYDGVDVVIRVRGRRQESEPMQG